MYSDQSIGSSSAGSSASWLAASSGESSLARSSLSVSSSTSSSSGFCMISCFRIIWSSSVGTWSSLSACCRRGVMMSAGRSDRLSVGFISMAVSRLEAETLAEGDLPGPRVAGQLLGGAPPQDPALVDDIGSIGDAQRLAPGFGGGQHAQPAAPPAGHDVLDLP